MNDWDLSEIRADIMLATDVEHLQAIDNYYENIINNLQSKIDKAIEYIENHSRFEPPYYEMREFNNNANLNELYDILKEAENVENN